MSLSGRLDVIFAEQLRNHPEGHALYNKVSADHLKPGTCGFFDEKGDWNVIEQLCDRETWESDGWIGIPEQLRTETDFGIQWPVKLSESAKGYEIDVDVNLKPPISGGINIAFKSSENVGAVLITDPPVERKRLKRDLPALDWVLQNTRKLLDHWPEILSRGLWIVTKTYSVKRCANAVLTAKDDEAKISIQASIPDVANAVPSATWWKQGSHGSWNIYTDDSGIVVFMSGIQCKVGLVRRSKLFPNRLPHKQKPWRDASSNAIYVHIEDDGDDTLLAETVPRIWGEVSSEVTDLIEGLHEAEENYEESDDSSFA